jgi:hypothetical protein
MWNFEDKIQTNDIAEICELLKSYKGKWIALVERNDAYCFDLTNDCFETKGENVCWLLCPEDVKPSSDKQFEFFGKYIVINNGYFNILEFNRTNYDDRHSPLCLDNWNETDFTTVFPVSKEDIAQFFYKQL